MLGGSLAAVGLGLAAGCAPSSPPPRRSERRRVVVIGTGFGGAGFEDATFGGAEVAGEPGEPPVTEIPVRPAPSAG